MPIPLVEVLRSVQRNVSAVHQTAAAAQGTGLAQVVVLEVHEHVFLIDFHDAHLYGRQVHRVEGKDEPISVGQDTAAEGNGYGRHFLAQRENAREGGGKFLSLRGADTRIQGELKVCILALEKHAYQIILHLHVAAGHAQKFHHAFGIGIHRAAA